MKDEYIQVIIGTLLYLIPYTITSLVINVFLCGTFVPIMIVGLIVTGIVFGVAFIVQLFKTNYKIIRKK